jgi:hypothetical protein
MKSHEKVVRQLETDLNHFDSQVRRQALAKLVAFADHDGISLPAIHPPAWRGWRASKGSV